MVRHVDVHLVSDLSGSANDVRTVSFTYGAVAGLPGVPGSAKRGIQYDIELSAEEREELDQIMQRYIAVARRRRGNPSKGGRLAANQGKVIRDWLIAEGKLDPRRTTGRLPDAKIQEYMDAHQGVQVYR